MTKKARVTARPHRGFWAMSGVLAGFAVLCAVTNRCPDANGETMPLAVILAILLAWGSGGIAVWLLNHDIRADEEGLRWRDRHGWHQTAWAAVADYYIIPATKENAFVSTLLCLDLHKGQQIRCGFDWQNVADFKAWVCRHAQATETAEWQVKGTRLRDLPLTFAYAPETLRKQRIFLWSTAGLFAALFFSLAFFAARDSWQNGKLLNAILLPLLVLATMTLFLVLLWMEIKPVYEAESRIGEEWLVYPEGFVFRDRSGEATAVRWEDVTGFDFPPRPTGGTLRIKPCRIRVGDGREFSFTRLTGARHLQTLIRRRALHAVEVKIDYNARNAVGGIAARWTGGIEGVGDRVFSARTRSNRFFVFAVPLLVSIAPAAILMLMPFGLTESHDPTPFVVPLALCGVVCLAGLVAYRTVKAVIGANGLVYYPPFGRRITVCWEAVQQVHADEGGLVIERVNQTALRVPTAFLAYGSEIAPLVAGIVSPPRP